MTWKKIDTSVHRQLENPSCHAPESLSCAMQQADAISLIREGITDTSPQYWADLGCGSGTFTLALKMLLPAGSSITAVDKTSQKLPVDFRKADFERDELSLSGLDGILMANSLHYVVDQQKLIQKLEVYFSTSPVFIIVEYDTMRSNPWVPFPVSFNRLQQLFAGLGYLSVAKLSVQPSRFGGSMYSALIKK